MRNKYQVTLLIRGDALAYSPEEIQDRISNSWSDISGCLFDRYLPYCLNVGAGELTNYCGISRAELMKKVAYQVYLHDYNYNAELCKELLRISRHFMDQSGLIFKDLRAISAANELKACLEKLNSSLLTKSGRIPYSYSSLDAELAVPQQEAYLIEVDKLMKETFDNWASSLIIPDELDKKGPKGDKNGE